VGGPGGIATGVLGELVTLGGPKKPSAPGSGKDSKEGRQKEQNSGGVGRNRLKNTVVNTQNSRGTGKSFKQSAQANAKPTVVFKNPGRGGTEKRGDARRVCEWVPFVGKR